MQRVIVYITITAVCVALAYSLYAIITAPKTVTSNSVVTTISGSRNVTIKSETVNLKAGSTVPFVIRNNRTYEVISGLPGEPPLGVWSDRYFFVSEQGVTGGTWEVINGSGVEIDIESEHEITVLTEYTESVKNFIMGLIVMFAVLLECGVLLIIRRIKGWI